MNALMRLLAPRWKAAVAAAGAMCTALLVVYPSSHVLQVVIAVIGALVTGAATHQTVNTPPNVPGATVAVTPEGIGASIGIDLPEK